MAIVLHLISIQNYVPARHQEYNGRRSLPPIWSHHSRTLNWSHSPSCDHSHPVQWDTMDIIQAQMLEPPCPEWPPGKTNVPSVFWQRVLHWVHSSLISGHPSITAMLWLLQNRFCWDTRNADTTMVMNNSVVPPPNLPDNQLWGCYTLSLHLNNHGHAFSSTW